MALSDIFDALAQVSLGPVVTPLEESPVPRLVALLKRYGRHDSACTAVPLWNEARRSWEREACNCGFAQALQEAEAWRE